MRWRLGEVEVGWGWGGGVDVEWDDLDLRGSHISPIDLSSLLHTNHASLRGFQTVVDTALVVFQPPSAVHGGAHPIGGGDVGSSIEEGHHDLFMPCMGSG